MVDKEKPTTGDAGEPPKRSRQRSPNYPAIGLEKALERAIPIKEQAGRHAMPIGVAYKAWDYKTGAGDQTVAALKAFGLIEVQGVKEKRQLKLTEAAWRILGNAPDRPELLKAAALRPEIHRKIWDKYEGATVSDAILSDYLKWELNFNATFVDSFIAQFRDTIVFANVSPSDNLTSEDSTERESEEKPMQSAPTTRTSPHVGPKAESFGTGKQPTEFRQMTELAFKLSRESDARVVIYGDASQEAIKKLRALLELSEDAFPTKAELYTPRLAVWRNKDHDQPVTVTGEMGEREGRRFYAVKETTTGIPEDELEFQG
jgi:hypothetical protein